MDLHKLAFRYHRGKARVVPASMASAVARTRALAMGWHASLRRRIDPPGSRRDRPCQRELPGCNRRAQWLPSRCCPFFGSHPPARPLHWRPPPLQKEMVGSGVAVLGICPVADPGGPVTGPGLYAAIEDPEGNVHAGDLLQPLAGQEVLGEQALAGTKAEEGLLSLLPPELEGMIRSGRKDSETRPGRMAGLPQ